MFILDTRGREESVEQLFDEVKKEIAAAGVEIIEAENLGRSDFARVTDAKMPAGNYVEVTVGGPADTARLLQEHFRLNPAVYRVFVQSA
jgi:small subunit ribosomal protein S6